MRILQLAWSSGHRSERDYQAYRVLYVIICIGIGFNSATSKSFVKIAKTVKIKWSQHNFDMTRCCKLLEDVYYL